MSGKINQFFYPFEQLKQVVVTGNDTEQINRIASHIREAIIKQSGLLAKIRHLTSGIENKDMPEEFLYLYNRYEDADCIKFTVKAEENLYRRLKMDLLIINLSFSSTLAHEHDESDKYELGERIKRSTNHDCPKLFLLNINPTLFHANHLANEVSKKLQDLLGTGEFAKAKDLLNEKGIRQMKNVHNYLLSYYPYYKKQEKIEQDVQVVDLDVENIIGLKLYTKLLNLDTSAITTINRY